MKDKTRVGANMPTFVLSFEFLDYFFTVLLSDKKTIACEAFL